MINNIIHLGRALFHLTVLVMIAVGVLIGMMIDINMIQGSSPMGRIFIVLITIGVGIWATLAVIHHWMEKNADDTRSDEPYYSPANAVIPTTQEWNARPISRSSSMPFAADYPTLPDRYEQHYPLGECSEHNSIQYK